MSISNVMVRRRGGELFEELSSKGKLPVKIVPIRFPIAEETYEVCQSINEPMGMVERYILEAITEFGPCSIDDIANLLSLDRSLIADMVNGMVKADVDLTRDRDQYSAGKSLRASIGQRQLTKRIRHHRRFAVNPLTGGLLPINFISESERWIVPFVTENEEGESTNWLRVRMGDRALHGNRALAYNLLSTDVKERTQLGIPEGAIAMTSETCLDRKLYSVLAFAVVTQQWNVEVYSAFDFSIPLSDKATSSLDYWNQVCHDVQPWIFADPRPIDEVAEFVAQNLNGVQCRAVNDSTLAVSVKNPDKVLDVDSRNESSESGALKMLQMDLVNGWYWSVNDFGVLRLIAGDAKTESRLVILRGVAKLREHFRTRTATNKLELGNWWKEFKATSSGRFSKHQEICSITFDKLLAEAEQVPDIRFLEWLDDATSAVEG
jgi:DNA-binding MarR family transcriptional regulator